uniref:MOR2-PAG1_N domain-containing protein n=1 Tax=Mesocestoides corti TaxID=53468 RepID=A0A5K3EZC4_MESCO
MHPIEEFVGYFTFLHELGQYFLEVKEKEIRHAMTCLFVEILLPVAAVVRHEVNIPALKNFVDLLYNPAFELASKKKHALALFPMVTCLLCVGTKSFFLTNWPPFMSLCLSQLKNRDLGQVSIESLFRLLWVYVVRIKCEKHTDTQNKLQSIVSGLFPKGSKSVLPKNVSSTVFVKIIHFIAQEKLDFAMTEIIFDLLGVNRLQKLVLTPERMNIGLRAFLLIAHGLQQKDGEPPMPQNQPLGVGACSVPGAPHARAGGVRRSFHGTTLDDTLCERLGIRPYLVHVRKAFEAILRLLDAQVCRNMMPPKQEVTIKDGDEAAPVDRKPKIDLLKTCVNCIPRLLPYEMSRTELIEFLARVSLNVDEEIRMMAQQTMVNLIIESPAYRQKTIQAFIQFIQKYVPDTSPHQLDSCLKTLHTLLVNWKIALQRDAAVTTSLSEKVALVEAEGFALVMLCQCRPLARRLAVHILRESRAVLHLINQAAANSRHEDQQLTLLAAANAGGDVCCIDILDSMAPIILERVLPLLPPHERHDLTNLSTVDFKSLAERSSPAWFCGLRQPSTWNHKPVAVPAPLLIPPSPPPHAASNPTSTAMSCPLRFDKSPKTPSGSNLLQNGTADLLCGRNVNEHSPMSKTTASKKHHLEVSPEGRRIPPHSPPMQPPIRPSAFCQSLLSPYILQPRLERTQLTDVWATALSVALSTRSPLSCHPAMLYTWNIVFHRLAQVFALIDPNAQAAENRTSSLLRSTSKKAPLTERDQLLPLWHNYVTLACCIAPSSTGVSVVDRKKPGYDVESADLLSGAVVGRRTAPKHASNSSTGSAEIAPSPNHETNATSTAEGTPQHPVCEPSAMLSPRQQQHLANSKLFIFAKEKARDLVKLIITLLRCDNSDLRESVICGLSRIQPGAFRDVLEDLHPILRESIDVKQKNVQRRRRKDTLRSSLIRLLALMAQNAVFQHDEAGITSSQGGLLPALVDFIEGTRVYLESLTEPSAIVVTMFGSSSSGTAGSSNAPAAVSMANQVNSAGIGVGAGSVGSTSISGSVTSGVVGGAVGGSTATGAGVGANPPNASGAPTTPSASAATSTAPSHAPTGVDPALLTEMRLYFCVFIRDLIRHLPRERRQRLLTPSMRRNLVLLISRWSGFYEHIHNSRDIKWSQPLWIDHPETPSEAKYPTTAIGTDQVISGDLVLSISGVRLDSGCQDPLISASFLDTSIWLELIWYANQSMAALVCCGSIYDTCALFNAPACQFPEVSTELAGQQSQQPQQFSSSVVEEDANMGTVSSATAALLSTPVLGSQSLSAVPMATQTNPAGSTFLGCLKHGGKPAPGYIFHWLIGLLLCRDAKLIISPWLWGLPVVNFGVPSTVLKGPHAKTGVRNIRLEDNLRSIVIAAVGGRRLDSLFRQLGEETLFLLLDMNADLPGFLDHLIDRCYTGTLNVTQALFVVITQRFIKNPRMACDQFTMLTLAMVFSEHSVPVIREHAIFLLQTLYYRFFLSPSRELHERIHPGCKRTEGVNLSSLNESGTTAPTSTPASTVVGGASPGANNHAEFCLSALADELLWREIGHWMPSDVIRQFCAQHPTCTLPMISEICRRLETASTDVRCRLLKLLHYWTINIELVDLFARPSGFHAFGETLIESSSGDGGVVAAGVEDASTAATLEPVSSSGKTEIGDNLATTTGPSSGSEEDAGQTEKVVVNKGNESGEKGVLCPSPAASESSSSSSTFNSSSNIDSSDCDSDLGDTGAPDGTGVVKKRGHQQRRPSDQSYKPEINEDKQKVNELWASVPLTLRRSGWGSLKATEMVLNNFLYLTIRFGNKTNEALALSDLWVLLIRYRPSNLRYIMRYLIVAASLAPATLSSHVNRVVNYLANEDPGAVVDVLMTELQSIDGAGLMIEPDPAPPYFRISVASDPSGQSCGGASGTSGSVAVAENATPSDRRQRRVDGGHLPDLITFSQRDDEVYGLFRDRELCGNQRKSMFVESNLSQGIAVASKGRPRSACGGPEQNGADGDAASPKIGEPSSTAIVPASSSSAISRLTNRFASSATAMGRRALRTALHGGGRQTKVSTAHDQEQLQEIDVDSLDETTVFNEDESSVLRTAADTMPQSQNYSTEAVITARSQTLPYTAASRERYNKQAVVGMDGTPLNRPSRLRKILSRRRTITGEKEARSSGGRRNPFRSIFRSAGIGGGSKASQALPASSSSTRLYTTSLPPNLATLQPLPLPLHSHSISNINDYRKKRASRRKRTPSRGRHLRVEAPLLATSLLLQQPLPMPNKASVYHAPMRDWFTEPFVTNASLVFSGMWSPTGARSPLVLVLVGEILKSHNKHRVDWRRHMPLLLLCLFLGLDHCRPLVQEESKKLLVNMLRVTCPRIDLLRLLSLKLEIDLHSVSRAMAGFTSRSPQFCLTIDDGPCVPKFSLATPTDDPLCEVSTCPTWASCCSTESYFPPNAAAGGGQPTVVPSAGLAHFSHSSSGTPPGGISPMTEAPAGSAVAMTRSLIVAPQSHNRPSYAFGSTYSLMSTATLIPAGLTDQEQKRRSIIDPSTTAQMIHENTEAQFLRNTSSDHLPLQSNATTAAAMGTAVEKSPVMTAFDQMVVATAPHDCEARHLHQVSERLKQLLIEVQDRSVWYWEDISTARFQQATLASLRSSSFISTSANGSSSSSPPPPHRESLILLRSARFLDRFVRCVVEAFAEAECDGRCAEAVVCLQCHHGPPHQHSSVAFFDCTVTRFAQAAFNMGITCPNRHYASRSLQIYRALEAQLDEKSLSEVLVRLVESISDSNEEVQGYTVELFLTLEAAVEHIQFRGTVLPISVHPNATASQSGRVGFTRPSTVVPPSDSPRLVSSLNRRNSIEEVPVAGKPPTPPTAMTSSNYQPTPPMVHERRHSRRSSASSLSNLIGVSVGAPSLRPSSQYGGSTASLGSPHPGAVPPIKRPLMPPHVEAASEDADTLNAVTAPIIPHSSPLKPTLAAIGVKTLSPSKPTASSDARSSSVEASAPSSATGTCRLAPEEQADLLAGIFWIGVCLLDSDFEYEYLAGVRLLSRLLPSVCMSPTPASGNRKWTPQQQQQLHPDLHEHVTKILNRLKWTTLSGTDDNEYPGLLSLLVKGCSSTNLIDPACRLLVQITPIVKSPIIDPNGATGELRLYRRATNTRGGSVGGGNCNTYPGSLPTLIITLLPMLLMSWDEDPESSALTHETITTTEAADWPVASGCSEVASSPAVVSPSPVGSWTHRGGGEGSVPPPPPSSGLLSLVTATIVSGAVAKKAPQLRPRNPICILAAENLAELALQTDGYRFTNLAVVLRLYATGSFSKDVNQWAKCVTRYLMDGCGGLGARILSFLTAFLTLGPPCVHLPLLHFAYWFLQTVELNQADMCSRIRVFIKATSERFVNTPLWPEVTLLYQVVVSRSATLTAAPANQNVYTLPGLDPSGSGRVLDSLAAAAAAAVPLPEAEPQRIALAGRVLEFDTSVLQSAPLIGGGRGQASPCLTTQHRSPARTNHLVETILLDSGKSFFRVGAWKTPWNRQARMRGLFTNLLNCYGSQLDHLAAPRSPSNSSRQKVIFSQSTETLDRQLSLHSSSETTSINDASNPDDGHFDDTSSAERAAVFHDLDTYLDAQLMNINFLDLPDGTWEDQTRCPWGVRGHSITSHAEFHEEGGDQQQQQPEGSAGESMGGGGCGVDGGALPLTSELTVVTEPINAASVNLGPLSYSPKPTGDVLTTSNAAVAGRQSQLSMQLSSASSCASGTGNVTLLAPMTSNRPFSSQLLVAWRSRGTSPTRWLPDGPSSTISSSNVSPPLLSRQDGVPISRKRTLSVQPPPVSPRKRLQDRAMLGGSLDSLPNQSDIQFTPVFKSKPILTPTKAPVPLSSAGSSISCSSLNEQEVVLMPVPPMPSPPPAKPPRKRRHSRGSFELSVRDPPPVPLRLSRSSHMIPQALGSGGGGGGGGGFTSSSSVEVAVDSKQLLTPSPSETGWVACMRHLKSTQWKAAEGARLTGARCDRLRLVLTGVRATFAGMLRRSAVQAVQFANTAFCKCPPSSDLDSEIRISNLATIAEFMQDVLPVSFFAIHPDTVYLLDDKLVRLCLRLGDVYQQWEDSLHRLSSTCTSSEAAGGRQHEIICRDLQSVLLLVITFFRLGVEVITGVRTHLADLHILEISDCSETLETLFECLKPHIGTVIQPTEAARSRASNDLDAWKPQCFEILHVGPDKVKLLSVEETRRALAVYTAAMKSSSPITMEDVMAILEAYCDQLWTNLDSGVAVVFARSPNSGVKRFEAFTSFTTPTTSASSSFFTTDDFLHPDSREPLPPLQLAAQLQRLLQS